MLGDSLTYGHELERHEALPAQLEAALKSRGRDVVVFNHGVSGNTTADALARVDAVLQDKPDIALVALGSNDSFDYWNNNVAEVERNLGTIIGTLQAAGTAVWLAGARVNRRLGVRNLVKVAINSCLELFGRPPAYHAQTVQYARRFNAVFARVAKQYGVPLYPHLLAGVSPNRKIDLLHPDATGVAGIVERLLPFVLDNLNAFSATASSHDDAQPAASPHV
jgi:acyl-CoA thioesterase-1